jgi:hypothetical protein
MKYPNAEPVNPESLKNAHEKPPYGNTFYCRQRMNCYKEAVDRQRRL